MNLYNSHNLIQLRERIISTTNFNKDEDINFMNKTASDLKRK